MGAEAKVVAQKVMQRLREDEAVVDTDTTLGDALPGDAVGRR